MKKDFLRLLKDLDEDELREELKMLYERFPVLREYYKLELSANTKQVLDKYKKDIHKSFFSTRSRTMVRRARSKSTKVLKDFKAVSIHPRDLVELHFYRVEVMTEAIDRFGIDSETFYISTLKSFETACELAKTEVLLEGLRHPVGKLVALFEQKKILQGYSLQPIYDLYWQ